MLRTTIPCITRVHDGYGIPVHLLSILCALVAPRVRDRALPGAPGTLAPSPSTASVRAIAMPWCQGGGMARIGFHCYRQPCHQSTPYTAVVQYQRRGPWSQYYLNRNSPLGSEEVRYWSVGSTLSKIGRPSVALLAKMERTSFLGHVPLLQKMVSERSAVTINNSI